VAAQLGQYIQEQHIQEQPEPHMAPEVVAVQRNSPS
jgi:hypothetical protein